MVLNVETIEKVKESKEPVGEFLLISVQIRNQAATSSGMIISLYY